MQAELPVVHTTGVWLVCVTKPWLQVNSHCWNFILLYTIRDSPHFLLVLLYITLTDLIVSMLHLWVYIMQWHHTVPSHVVCVVGTSCNRSSRITLTASTRLDYITIHYMIVNQLYTQFCICSTMNLYEWCGYSALHHYPTTNSPMILSRDLTERQD